ncbi:hypothetical protein DN069_27770 [Streptacidiphilus pinicola]|uniref:ChsH2 C-terminal OB-fold domain-containing protein n=1 Tax=Streptacidiphilus pinicola TaxID=2219663 RepID=A0A2X0IBY3_9ACTN|nr:OB-fold domain-containing protein [Streptacidiphilus pinicola]RAG82464.1 hypothetical protein DN069_27770 [Streptacidiphilus pinicola]
MIVGHAETNPPRSEAGVPPLPDSPRRSPAESDALSFQRCCWCSIPVFPAALLCPVCGCADLRWQQSRGTGRVNRRHGSIRGEEPPRHAATVQLDEGPRVMAVIEGARSASVKVGVKVRFHGTHTPGERLPVFRLNLEPDSPATFDSPDQDEAEFDSPSPTSAA